VGIGVDGGDAPERGGGALAGAGHPVLRPGSMAVP
jgi:hypothetical protein